MDLNEANLRGADLTEAAKVRVSCEEEVPEPSSCDAVGVVPGRWGAPDARAAGSVQAVPHRPAPLRQRRINR